MTEAGRSPVADMYERLRALHAGWGVDVGRPTGAGWIAGDAFRDAASGPFRALLERIGARSQTDDRRTIAGSFALHFGWTSAMAIAPFLHFRCVPDCSLGNIAIRFNQSAYVDGTAVYDARGTVVADDPCAHDPAMRAVPDEHALLRALRDALVAQAAPVVEAVYEWSAFAERATWGVLTSLWASHFISLWRAHDDQRPLARLLDAFYAGDDVVAEMRPEVSAAVSGGRVHLHVRRASCCRFYLVPAGGLCTSCPLGSDGETGSPRAP
ncbi:MAG TPA: (2Fe-2S)-binding protein [Gemmatimonadaceae bacterium]|nr:(2Fe-2S)-binding protein [Gemmatimonadaceae bacterium]